MHRYAALLPPGFWRGGPEGSTIRHLQCESEFLWLQLFQALGAFPVGLGGFNTAAWWRGGERSLLPLTAFTRFQLPIRLPRWFVGPGPRRGFGEAGQRDRGFVIFSASLSSFGFNSSIERNDSFRTSTHCVSALDERTQASTGFIINPSPGECG